MDHSEVPILACHLANDVDTSNDSTDRQSPVEPKCRKLSETEKSRLQEVRERNRRNQLLKNCINLLDPEATSIASLMDLTQQDYEVNAPVGSNLLQGIELLTALDTNTNI